MSGTAQFGMKSIKNKRSSAFDKQMHGLIDPQSSTHGNNMKDRPVWYHIWIKYGTMKVSVPVETPQLC